MSRNLLDGNRTKEELRIFVYFFGFCFPDIVLGAALAVRHTLSSSYVRVTSKPSRMERTLDLLSDDGDHSHYKNVIVSSYPFLQRGVAPKVVLSREGCVTNGFLPGSFVCKFDSAWIMLYGRFRISRVFSRGGEPSAK